MTLAKFSFRRLIIIVIVVGAFWPVFRSHWVLLSGDTMGTTYHVNVRVPFYVREASLKADVDERLQALNLVFSTYTEDSELAQINRLSEQNSVSVSFDMAAVLMYSLALFRQAQGAWNPAIGPLVNAWGFGNSDADFRVPSEEVIRRLLRHCSFESLVFEGDSVFKKDTLLALDFSSVAKGYAVDQIVNLLLTKSLKHFMVEIGGEVRVNGENSRKKFWNIAIRNPKNPEAVFEVLSLNNQAMATSGDYFQYFEMKGQRYSHILDARTGYPKTNAITSVTVVAPTCMQADGLATALMVLSVEEGQQLVASLDEEVRATWILENEASFKVIRSTN